jgi:hypothetical protein
MRNFVICTNVELRNCRPTIQLQQDLLFELLKKEDKVCRACIEWMG